MKTKYTILNIKNKSVENLTVGNSIECHTLGHRIRRLAPFPIGIASAKSVIYIYFKHLPTMKSIYLFQ